MTEYFRNILALIMNEPPSFVSTDGVSLKEDEFGISRKLADILKGNKRKLVFIIGQWGSGKTTHLRYFISKFNKSYDFVEKSFFRIQSLREGYLHLLSMKGKLLTSILLILAAFIVPMLFSDSKWHIDMWKIGIAPLAIFIVHIFVTNTWNLYYTIVNALSIRIRSSKKYRDDRKEVIIVEDLDRSSMSIQDQWALLSHLWYYDKNYIVTYGYQLEDDKYEIIHMAQKLEAAIIELPLNHMINYNIALAHEPKIPFNSEVWLNLFTPRELLHLIDRIKREVEPYNCKIMYEAKLIHGLLHDLVVKLGIDAKATSRIHVRYGDCLDFSYDGTEFTASYVKNMLRSYGKSIKASFFSEFSQLFTDEERSSSNWLEVKLGKCLLLSPA